MARYVDPAILALAFAIRVHRLGILRGWLLAQSVVGVLLLAWLAYASRVSLGYTRTLPGALSLWSTVKDSLVDYSVGTSVPYGVGTRIALVFLGVIAVGFWSLREARCPAGLACFRAAFLGGYLFVPVIGGFLVSLVRELYEPRYLMVSAPAFFLALGLGLVGLYRQYRPLGVGIGLFLVGTEALSLHNAWTDPRYDKAELADAITYVQQHLSPGDGVILDGFGQSTVFWYYNDVQAARPIPAYEFTPPAPAGGRASPRRSTRSRRANGACGSSTTGYRSTTRSAWSRPTSPAPITRRIITSS